MHARRGWHEQQHAARCRHRGVSTVMYHVCAFNFYLFFVDSAGTGRTLLEIVGRPMQLVRLGIIEPLELATRVLPSGAVPASLCSF